MTFYIIFWTYSEKQSALLNVEPNVPGLSKNKTI